MFQREAILSAGVLRWGWHGTEPQQTHVRLSEWVEVIFYYSKKLGSGESFVNVA